MLITEKNEINSLITLVALPVFLEFILCAYWTSVVWVGTPRLYVLWVRCAVVAPCVSGYDKKGD